MRTFARCITAAVAFFIFAGAADDLAQITTRGRALYEYDDAAAKASDAVQKIAASAPQPGFEYIGHTENQVWVFDFGTLSQDRSAFTVQYRATQDSKTKTFTAVAVPPATLASPSVLSQARAVALSNSDFGLVRRPYNYAIIPADGGQWYVYVYPAQTNAAIHPLGGDVRYLVSTDGSKIVEKHQMHRAILEIAPAAPPGQTVAAAFHTDIFGDVPEDTDVFDALISHRPEYVSARGHLFEVQSDGTIRPVSGP